jgi:hypothetical protein
VKVIKLDIKQETLDVDSYRPYYYFFERDGDFPSMLMKEEELPSTICKFSRATYKLMRYQGKYNKEITNYLIKLEEHGLVDIFAKMEQDILSTLINEKVKEKLDCGDYVTREFYFDGVRLAEKSFKQLSWWKRLFINFLPHPQGE